MSRVVAVLDRGEWPDEGELQRALCSPWCPSSLIERLTASPRLLRSRRLVALVLTHPGCPRTFAWDALPRLPWSDLASVARRPRTPVPVRKHAERKLVERLGQLTIGERTTLARVAPRGLIGVLLTDIEVGCVRALLDNSRFTEDDAVRLIGANTNRHCAMAVLRHPRWGSCRAVKEAALRSPRLPLAVLMGLIVALSPSEVEALARSRDVPKVVQATAHALCEHRREKTGLRVPGADHRTPEPDGPLSGGPGPVTGG